MRRKLLSVVLCVCMMLTMAPFAFAEEGDGNEGTPTPYATDITDTGASTSTLQSQIDSASSGSTLTLNQDYTESKDNTITIPQDKSITLDLANHTLKGQLSVLGDLTIKNGTVKAYDNSAGIYAYGKLTLDSVTLTGAAKPLKDTDHTSLIYVCLGSNVTIDADSKVIATDITAANPDPAIFIGNEHGSSSTSQTLNIYGEVSTAKAPSIQGNGTDRSVSHINIYDGAEVKSNKVAIFLPQPCEVNMTGGTVEGYCGIGMKSGTLNLSGGIVNGTSTDTDISDQYSKTNGISYDGSAILIDSYIGYAGQVKINISGDATVKSNYSTAIREIGNTASQTNVVSVTVTGGKVLSGASKDAIQMREASVSTVSLTGGTFSSDVSQYCAKNYYTEKNDNNTYSVKSTKDVAVAQIGDTYYRTLTDAVEAAESGSTVALLKDTKEKVTVSKDLTVDLGGNTLTGSDLTNGNNKPERVAFTANAGNVTIQNGTVDGRVNAYDAGNLTIAANLTIKNSYNGEGYDCFGIVVWGDATNSKTPKLTVNGKVTLEKGGIAISTNGNDKSNAEITINKGAVVSSNEDGAIYLPSGKLIMNGGTISGPTGIQICAGSANINSEFQLNGGTVIATGDDQRTSKGTGDGLIPDGAAISVVNRGYPNGVPTVAINGGFFSSAKNDAVLAYNWSAGAASNWAEATSHVSITNGYFTSDPTSYLANDRYSVPSDKDGYTYMVSNTAPTTPSIFVKDQTETTVDEKITEANAAKINAVISKANVDGTAEAVSSSGKDAIVNSANVPTTDNNDKITIDVKVTVSATFANLTDDSSASTLTFTAIPVATVSVNGEQKAANISVPNDYLNGKEITVKLPLPSDFTPVQIKHTSSDGSVEYFLSTQKRGAKTFTIEDGCAVFTITKFSTFEVSGTQTYVEPSSGGSISTPTTYAVNVNAATNGAVAADKKTASKGTTVTVTASPSKGYVVDAVKVVDKDGKDVAVTVKDGKYVFTMPASAVTVTGSFKVETPAPVAMPFTDVKSSNWFYDAVKYAYAQGLMTGTSATTFAPNGTMNRAMIVTVLYRLEKSPAVTGASKFTDVPAGQWYSDAVAWAAANKIVNGYDETTFGPMNAVTREQMAAILFRYEQVKGLENVTLEENLNRFPDQDKISAYAIPALQWAVSQKIINGNADGTLDPTGTATRAQVAQIFTNLLNK